MNLARVVSALAFASSLVACAASAEPEGEEAAEATSALANNGGGAGNGFTAADCRSCGCSLVYVGKTDSCRLYKCVCDTEEAAKCASGKAASLISVPFPPPRAVGAGATVGSSVLGP